MNTTRRFGKFFCLAAILVSTLPLFSQTPQIYTVAGSGAGVGIQQMGNSIADSQGNIYATDSGMARVVKVTNVTSASPTFSVVAGTGVRGYLGDNGIAINAQLKSPCSVALDATETNLYIADGCGYSDGRVRRVDLQTGIITLVASGFNPQSVAVDSHNNIFVVDGDSFGILKITSGVASVFYTSASFGSIYPYVVAIDRSDSTDSVYFSGFSPSGYGVIVAIPNYNGIAGPPEIVAGTGTASGWDGSPVSPLALNMDYSPVLAVSNGYVYFNSQMDNRIGRFASDGTGAVQLIAGNGTTSVSGDGGLAITAGIGNYDVYGLAVSGGTVVFGGSSPQVMRYFTIGGNIASVNLPGNPSYQGDGGAATSATISTNTMKVAFDAAGNMYIADQGNRAIRKVDQATGIISTAVVGTQLDTGLPANTTVGNFNIANDPQGNIYIATYNNGLFKLTNAGVFSQIVPATGFSSSTLNDLAVDTDGNVYVIAGYRYVNRVSSTGTNLAVVYSNSNATLLSLGIDSNKNVWVTQATGTLRNSFSLAQVSPSGASQSLANIGAQAVATYPVTGDPRGGVVYMDNFAAKSFVSGSSTTIAGQVGTIGFSGDNGPAIDSTLGSALGLAFDSYCHLYISDSQNQRIRKVENLVNATVNTNQSDAVVTVDGTQGGGSYTWLAGIPHTLSTSSPQTPNSGTQLVFKNWSLPGNQTNSSASFSVTPGCVVAPTYTANFDTKYQLTTSASPSEGGSVTSSGGYYTAGSSVTLQATPNPGYGFDHWEGSVTSPNSATTTITMNGPQTVVAHFSPLADLSITMTHAGNFIQGSPATYTIAVTNNGPTSANTTVQVTLPVALTAPTMIVAGLSCSSGTLTCTGVIAPGASSTITLTASISNSAPSVLVSTATVMVTGGIDPNLANNTATDAAAVLASTTITLAPNPGATITYGTALAVTASVTQAVGFPSATGTFNYRIDSGAAQPAVLTNGSAALPLGVLTAGTHTLTVDYSGSASYLSGQQTLAITVNPALLTIKADNKSRPYAAADPAFTASYSAFVNNEDQSQLGGILVCATTATASSNVIGSPYQITCSGRTAANYNIVYAPGELTVIPAPLFVSVRNEIRPYGVTNPTLGGTITGVVAGDNITATYSTDATPASLVGTHAITATLVDPNNRLGNYLPVNTPGTLTITPAALTVVANSASRAYGAANPVFSGTLTGAFAGDGISATYATTAAPGSPAGNYPITATLLDPSNKLSNYSVMNTPGTLTVDRASLSVTANDKQRTYGTANNALDGVLEGMIAGDGITATYTTLADATSPVGTYPISALLADPNGKLANYVVSNTPGKLTVTAALLSVTANSKQRTYGTANPQLDGSLTGIVSGDNITATYATTATASSSAGNSYAITATLVDPNNRLSNYSIANTPGVLTVTPAALSVAADSTSRTYGAANPMFGGTVIGAVAGDNITATYSTSASAASPVGTYPITAALNDPSNKLANYTVSRTDGTLTVNQSAIYVRAGDKQRIYGAVNPTFDGTLTGVVPGDNVTATYSSVADTASPVGSYPITATLIDSGNRLSNYAVTNIPGTLTVALAELKIAAGNATRRYGADNPLLTGTMTGLAAGDNITGAYSTAATTAANVGDYEIVPALVDPANRRANYVVTLVNGTLRVTPAPLTVTTNSKTRVYKTQNPTLDGSIAGLQNADPITASFSTTATELSDAGAYAITATLADPANKLPNYVVTNSGATLTVTAAATTTALTTVTTTTHAGENVTFTATVGSTAGTPTGSVTFLNGTTSMGTVSLSSGLATLSTSALANGNSVITARYEGATNFLASTSAPVNQTVIAPVVTVASTSGQLNLSAPVGQAVTAQLTIGTQGRVTAPITLSCSGLPVGAQCVFSPASINPSQVPATVSVTISTTRLRVVGAVRPFRFQSSLALALLLPGVVLLPPMFGAGNRKRKFLLLAMFTLLLLGMVSCGGSQGSGITNVAQSTPPGTYTVTVTATSAGATTGSANIVLTVTH